jgi:hypothetical protein
MNNIKTLTKEEILSIFKFQQENTGWTFYSEREFIENLFNQRFNYLIIMYSLFLTAAATVNTKQNLLIVLWLGLLFTSLVSMTIYRAFVKLIIILRILYKLENHVLQVVDKEMTTWRWKKLFRANQIVGIIIPLIILFTFVLGIILTSCNIIKP